MTPERNEHRHPRGSLPLPPNPEQGSVTGSKETRSSRTTPEVESNSSPHGSSTQTHSNRAHGESEKKTTGSGSSAKDVQNWESEGGEVVDHQPVAIPPAPTPADC